MTRKSMAKKRETETIGSAERVANAQRCGYLNADEYDTFLELCAKIRIKPQITTLHDILLVRIDGRKFYADNE
jgi:hypothetical protein